MSQSKSQIAGKSQVSDSEDSTTDSFSSSDDSTDDAAANFVEPEDVDPGTANLLLVRHHIKEMANCYTKIQRVLGRRRYDKYHLGRLELKVKKTIADMQAAMAVIPFNYNLLDPGKIPDHQYYSPNPKDRVAAIRDRHDYWLMRLDDADYPWGNIH